MKALVIGASGQVARALAALDGVAGDEIVCVGRPQADFSDAVGLARLIGEARPHIVINAAAYTAVDAAETDEAAAMAANAEGPGRLAQACAAAGVPLIHLSTDYVFDGRKGAPYLETDPTAPLGAYGRSKREGELAVAAAQPRSVIARTSWVYAPWGKNFLRTMLRLAGQRPRLGVVADQHGSPTYAPHLAEALLAVSRRVVADPPAEAFGVFHMTGSDACTWAEFAAAIFTQAAARGGPAAAVDQISTSQYPTPAPRPADSRLSGAKLAAVYGLALPDWRDGVAACLDVLAAQAWPEA